MYFILLAIKKRLIAGMKMRSEKSFSIIFLVIILLFSRSLANAQRSVLRFKHYTINQGLSQNMIDCLLKDSKGYMWFGTWNGLNRFDGYTFLVYRNNPRDKNTISNNFIFSIAEDKFGNLWLGTASGLDVYLYECC